MLTSLSWVLVKNKVLIIGSSEEIYCPIFDHTRSATTGKFLHVISLCQCIPLPLLIHQFRDPLTFSAWYLLELIKDISKAQTHFLAVTLHRTTSSNPRILYSLVDAEVLPLSALEGAYANRAHFTDSSPVSPRSMLAMDEQQRRARDGALGSVMVLSIELPKGDNRPPHKALSEVRWILTRISVHFIREIAVLARHSYFSASRAVQRTQGYHISHGEVAGE